MHLRNKMVGAGLAAALAVVPAQALAKQSTTDPVPGTVYVCNTARTGNQGGTLDVSSADQQGALHGGGTYLMATGNGNLNAASHSRALALCTLPATTDTPPVVVGT